MLYLMRLSLVKTWIWICVSYLCCDEIPKTKQKQKEKRKCSLGLTVLGDTVHHGEESVGQENKDRYWCSACLLLFIRSRIAFRIHSKSSFLSLKLSGNPLYTTSTYCFLGKIDPIKLTIMINHAVHVDSFEVELYLWTLKFQKACKFSLYWFNIVNFFCGLDEHKSILRSVTVSTFKDYYYISFTFTFYFRNFILWHQWITYKLSNDINIKIV